MTVVEELKRNKRVEKEKEKKMEKLGRSIMDPE